MAGDCTGSLVHEAWGSWHCCDLAAGLAAVSLPAGSHPAVPGGHRGGADQGSSGPGKDHHHLQPGDGVPWGEGECQCCGHRLCLPFPGEREVAKPLAFPTRAQWPRPDRGSSSTFRLCSGLPAPPAPQGAGSLPRAQGVSPAPLSAQIYEVVRPLVSLLHLQRTGLENFEGLMALTNLAGISERLR